MIFEDFYIAGRSTYERGTSAVKCKVLSVVFEGMIWQERCSKCGTLHYVDELEMNTETGQWYCLLCLKEMYKPTSKVTALLDWAVKLTGTTVGVACYVLKPVLYFFNC